MSQVIQDPLEAGRDAVRRHAWQEGYELLKTADSAGELSGEDLELLAEATLWVGGIDEYLPIQERAYAAHARSENTARAAYIATQLAHDYDIKLESSLANGWLRRAARLLENEPESPAHGYFALQEGLKALGEHDFDRALAAGKEAEEIGRRLGDRSLEVRGIQRQGNALIQKGELIEGRALLDEASVSALSGELDPYSTLVVYCNTIGACRDVADFDRAGQWTERASEFCDSHSMSAFPGMCRVNRVEVMKFKGDLQEASHEADRAGEELRTWNPRVAGAAFYEIGEIRLRLGELAQAEQAFREADEYGKDPEPGRSLLLFAKGETKAAAAAIRRPLADETLGLPAQARLLPAAVEILVGAGDLDAAADASAKFKEIAAVYETSALKAASAHAHGSVLLAQGDTLGAASCLRQALRLWQEIGAMYETARTRELLGLVLRAEGDEGAAVWELQAAAARFERLGAIRDGERVAGHLMRDLSKDVMKTFLFTDIVGSTELAGAVKEDRHWGNLLRRHDDTLRKIFAEHEGQVVDHTGDGFFTAFEDPAAAVKAAVAVQRSVAEDFPFDLRIGLHTDGALQRQENYHGKGVHAAARIGAAAEAQEILASHATMEHLGQFKVTNPRPIALKGFEEPVDVCSVEWRS
ncbi:MAG: adenylate/guanylate cyclase domain-containing protein [Gaiellaceae bacterium]